MVTLFPYQERTVKCVRELFSQGCKSPLLVSPTGSGKTIMFSYIAVGAIAKGGRVLILVHRYELLKQTSAALDKFGIAHGLIHSRFTPDFTKPVQVASVQTLVNRLDYAKLFMPTLTVIDEAHHSAASTWGKIFEAFKSLRVGVTATPCRQDGKGLSDVFDGITIGAEVQELIDLGRLVQPVYYCPSQVDLKGVSTNAGDYVKSQLEERVDKPTITGDAVEHYRKLAHGVPAVAFCVSRKHAEHVAAQFRDAGYEAYAVDGMTDDKERDRILTGLGNGTVQVVASCDLISEGFDVPAIGCGIMLRPTKSLALYIQQGGRVLRPQAGKDRAIILDHVGNVFRHGLLEQPREWSLDGEEKSNRKKKENTDEEQVNVKQCTKCYAVFAPAPTCPECGAPVEIKARKLEQREGELVAIDKEAIKIVAFQKKQEVSKARTLDELKAIEAQRGYKKGWAYNIWKAREIKQQNR